MKIKYCCNLFFVLALLISSSCSINSKEKQSEPNSKVKLLIKKHNLKVVEFDYVKNAIGDGTRKGAKVLLVDARPHKKYIKGTIPSSINIPDTSFVKAYSKLGDIKKDREIIVFCGGWKCSKSPKVAQLLRMKGHTNVGLFQAGVPSWKKKSYLEVDTRVVKSAQEKNNAVLIDARPYKKFLQGTIPGAISIPDKKMKKLSGKFPADKSFKVIIFCGGYNCDKSHKVANKMISLG